MLYLSDINKSFVFVDLFKAEPKAPGVAAPASPGAGVGAAGPKAPAAPSAPAAPGAPKSAAPKLQSAGPKQSKSIDCPLGREECIKNGGTGKHVPSSNKYQDHAKLAQSKGISAPAKAAETSEGKLEGAEASPGVTPDSANIGSIGSDKAKPPEPSEPEISIDVEAPVTETRSQMMDRLRGEAVAKQEKEGFKPTLSEADPEIVAAAKAPEQVRKPPDTGKRAATVADVKSGLAESAEDTRVTPNAHRGLAQMARNLGDEELAAKHEFAAKEKERVGSWKMPSEEELASPDVDSVRASYSQAKDAREKGLDDIAQLHETDAKQKASKLTSDQHKQLAEGLRESGFEKEADYHQGIHDFVQGKTERSEKLRSNIENIKQKDKLRAAAAAAAKEPAKEEEPDLFAKLARTDKIKASAEKIKQRIKEESAAAEAKKLARTEKLRGSIDRIKEKEAAKAAATKEPELSERAKRIKERLKAARPISASEKPITVEDSDLEEITSPETEVKEPSIAAEEPTESTATEAAEAAEAAEAEPITVEDAELEEIPELSEVTPAHKKRQYEAKISGTRKAQEEKAKNVLAEAKAKHEETKKKAQELRDSNAKKVAEYQSNLENYEKQKEGGVKKLRKPKKPKLEKEVKVEDQPELKEPETDSERLTHGNHTSRAKKNAELIESHLVNNPNLSKEDRSRLEQAHAISSYHASIDHVPSSSHKSELAEAEKTTRDLGIKESWESQKQRETAASEAAAAKQKDVETQAKVREQKIAEKKQAIKERLDSREQAKQEKQQAKQEKQQAKEEETQRKQQGYAPETDLDNARVQDHRSRAQRLRSNLESHINDNPEMSNEDREKARTIIASLDEHENRTDVPGSVQAKELKDLEKLAGSHGKSTYEEKKPPKVGGRPAAGTSNALRYLTSKMKQGWAQGGGLAADVASESGPGRLGSRLLNYGITGAASVGHKLLSGGKAGEQEAVRRYTAEMENAKKEEAKNKENEESDNDQNPELYIDDASEQPTTEQVEAQAEDAQEAVSNPEDSEPSNPVPASQKSATIPERPSNATPAAQKSLNLYLSRSNASSSRQLDFSNPALYLK